MKSKSLKRAGLALGALAVVGGLSFLFVQAQAQAASALTSAIRMSLSTSFTSTKGLINASAPLDKRFALDLANGVAANQANAIWTDTRTISASGTDSIDVAGALVDAFGTAFTPAKVKGVFISASSANTNNLLVGGDTNALLIFADPTDIHAVKPGGVMALFEPGLGGLCSVTASTGDILKIVNSAGTTSVTYDIVIIGTTS